jgi:hypothetical protein
MALAPFDVLSRHIPGGIGENLNPESPGNEGRNDTHATALSFVTLIKRQSEANGFQISCEIYMVQTENI